MRSVTVRQRKLYEGIADHLEQMIRDGEFAESERLPSERDLMRHFGVGRPAVREALFHLRKMGLVELRSGERAKVTRPTPQFVIDALSGTARHMLGAPGGVQNFQNARLFFEVGLARHALTEILIRLDIIGDYRNSSTLLDLLDPSGVAA